MLADAYSSNAVGAGPAEIGTALVGCGGGGAGRGEKVCERRCSDGGAMAYVRLTGLAQLLIESGLCVMLRLDQQRRATLQQPARGKGRDAQRSAAR